MKTILGLLLLYFVFLFKNRRLHAVPTLDGPYRAKKKEIRATGVEPVT